MSITGDPDGPPFRLGLPVADLVAGLFAAQGILLALLDRARTGRGRHVDISMFDSVAALLTYQAANYLATGTNPPRMGNAHASIVPYGTFETRDGQLMLAIGNDDQWRRFCDAAFLPDLAADPRFVTNPQRVANRHQLLPMVSRMLKTRDRAEWTSLLREAAVPCGPVRTIGEMLADPQLEARDMIVSITHPTAGDVRVMGNPLRMSGDGARPDAAPPRLGEHTDAILTELGVAAAELNTLRHEHVI